MRRLRIPDPAPLPTDAPKFADRKAARDYGRQQRAAIERMREFDGAPRELRDLWNATGRLSDARYLRAIGVTTFEEAEQMVADS